MDHTKRKIAWHDVTETPFLMYNFSDPDSTGGVLFKKATPK